MIRKAEGRRDEKGKVGLNLVMLLRIMRLRFCSTSDLLDI